MQTPGDYLEFVKMLTSTTGQTTPLVLTTALPGFGDASDMIDGIIYDYTIIGLNIYERGTGAAGTSGGNRTIARTNILRSSAGGTTKVTMTGNEIIAIGSVGKQDALSLKNRVTANIQASFSAATNAANLAAAVAMALALAPAFPGTGMVVEIPPVVATITAFPAMPTPTISFEGWGASLTATSAIAIDLGADSYLTNLAAGNYIARFRGFFLTLAAGATGIKNRGVRTLEIDLSITGGAHALDSEGAYARSRVNLRAQSQTGDAVILRQRNNNLQGDFAILTGGANGLVINSTSINGGTAGAENELITVRADIEGCTGDGLSVDGLCKSLTATLFTEGNTGLSARIKNTAGGSNKGGILFLGGSIGDTGITIGDDLAGTLITGVRLIGVKFGNANLTILNNAGAETGLVKDWKYEACSFEGTSTVTGPTSGLNEAGGSALYRYITAAVAPFGTGASGLIGDIRWEVGRLWNKVASSNGWRFVQTGKVVDSTTPWVLPTGATPDLTGLHHVQTGNVGATNVTAFLNGYASQQVRIVGADGGNTTIVHGTNIRLLGGANFNLGDMDSIILSCFNGTKWYEETRSNNA